MASQGLTASLQTLGPCLTFYPKLARAIGLKESILLCQLIYWTPRSKREGGWVYKSAEEFEAETGLSYKEQRRVREVLRARGLIEERNAKDEHRLYFRVIPEALDRAFDEHLPNGHMPESQEAPAQREDGTCPKGSSLIGTEITQKEITHSSRRKGERRSDERHMQFKEAIKAYWDSKNAGVEMPWGGAEGKALGMFLREAPHITLEVFTGFLRARFKSEVNHGDRPSFWIRWITSYGNGPIDRFGKPLTEGANGTNRSSVTHERVNANISAIGKALEKRGVAGIGGAACPDGAAVSSAGPERLPGGLPVGLRTVGAEVFPVDASGRSGSAEDPAGPELFPPA